MGKATGRDKDRLEAIVSVRLSPREENAIRSAAEKNGLTVSSYMRRAALTSAVPISARLEGLESASRTASVGITLTPVGDRLVARSIRPPRPQQSSYSEPTQ